MAKSTRCARAMRRLHATIKFNFFGRWPRTRARMRCHSSEREEDERIFPPHRSHEATTENERCEGARNNQPSFWRLETREQRSRERRSQG